ncbi:MAG TPA: TAT-variant-translocated molybdopterin oxidoreductase [Gemmatimonadales bacterium]|nr:TAT-variant-translocated molybdopterin oxidoreductase [Gemmatimonadales bacterium]
MSNDRHWWRDLDELLDTPDFREALGREFPAGAAELADGMTRRSFVRLLGASIALAGVGGCFERPRERILPYVSEPPESTPGLARHYATSMTLGGYATGLLVESHAGRPTKIEGNPDHPASLGAAGVYEQASILQLYDPERARAPRLGRGKSSWSDVGALLSPARLGPLVGARGAGLGLLLEPSASPLSSEMLGRVREGYPEAGVHFYSPLGSRASDRAALTAFGRALLPQYDFRSADVVLSLDADFLAGVPFSLRYARDFADRRRIAAPTDEMNRLYVIEPGLSVTGGTADHRLRVRAGEVESLAGAVLAEVTRRVNAPGTRGGQGIPGDVASVISGLEPPPGHREWITALARDLDAHPGRTIVIAGERQPPRVHVLAHLLNAALGNVGRTVRYIESPLLEAGAPSHELAPLVEAMRGGAVRALLVLDGNPAYTAPADLEFAAALRRVPTSIYHGLYENETARACGAFVPSLHYLESWADGRAWDGTASLVQPLVAPLYGGKTDAELLAALIGDSEAGAHELLQELWRGHMAGTDFANAWDEALQRGVIAGSAASETTPAWRWGAIGTELAGTRARADTSLELVLDQDPSVYDGRFANNVWLQELPDPVTKLTWGNAALLSPATAARLQVATGDVVELAYHGRTLRVPAFLLPGHAVDSVSLRLGYGRGAGDEAVADGVGANAYRLLTGGMAHFGGGLAVSPALGDDGAPLRERLATTQTHWRLEGRPVALRAALDDYRRNPAFAEPERGRVLSLYEPGTGSGDQWAMVIDLATCTGCSACVVACQAENNIPVVGKEGVLDGREMHWLRIDRYFEGSVEDPAVLMQPMLCQHCEKAPCEYVCPVSATLHSPDGLNEMVYNRCIGTRFCSNNCPYKVRRFNWFDYNAEVAETERMAKNPDVTVRGRGVMEKCTFCVQRIREAQIAAGIEGAATGEVRTACQQACPARAITFGSLNDPESELVRRRAEPRRYAVLHELGTVPRVQYLAAITNPNPELPRGDGGG